MSAYTTDDFSCFVCATTLSFRCTWNFRILGKYTAFYACAKDFIIHSHSRPQSPSFLSHVVGKRRACTATEMIPTIEMISATEMTPNHHRNDPHHRNDTFSQSKWSRHKFSEPWLQWTWDFAIYSKFFVYSYKHDSKQRKIEKAIRLITVLYTDFIFKILIFF